MNGIKLSDVNDPITSAFEAYLFLMGVPALNAYTKGNMLLIRPMKGNRRNESEMILSISEGKLILDE
jgi:phosphatidylserine decarboxylase